MEERVSWLSVWRHAGAGFATFWIVWALFALGVYLVWAFLQLDAEFSRPLAGGVVPEHVTQQIAWGTRAFSVIAGSLAIYFHVQDMPRWRTTFSVFTVLAAVILLLHAYGVSAKIMQKQYDADLAIEQVATVNTDSIDQQIETIQAQKAEIRSDTSLTVETYREAIANITSDGLDNDDQADTYRADITQALQVRDERIRTLDAQIAELQADARSTTSVATQAQADSDSFNPLFTFLARISTGVWSPAENPSDTHKFAWGVIFFTLFFGFGELLMMASFTGGYAALKVVSERKLDDEKDPIRVEAGRKAAKTRARNSRQIKKIREAAEGYLPKWQKAVRYARTTRWTAEGIAQNAFPDGNIMHAITVLRRAGLATDEEIALVMREDEHLPVPGNSVDVIRPESNGADNADNHAS